MLKIFRGFTLSRLGFISLMMKAGIGVSRMGSYINQNVALLSLSKLSTRILSNAWWQLVGLYKPVVKSLFGDGFDYRLLEVIRWFEPSVNFPNIKQLLIRVMPLKAPNVGVHILPESVLSGR